MATLLNSKCGVPIFVQTDKNVVGECGLYKGYITCIVITFFMAISAIMILFAKPKAKPNIDPEKQKQEIRKQKMVTIGLLFLVLVLIWIFLPRLTKFMDINSWNTYQHEIDGYVAQGMTRTQAINQLQSLYQAQMQAAAISSIGQNLGGSGSGGNGSLINIQV
jgi:hypothetical protein